MMLLSIGNANGDEGGRIAVAVRVVDMNMNGGPVAFSWTRGIIYDTSNF